MGERRWINLAQDKDKLEGCCEHGNETSGHIKCENYHCRGEK